MTKNSDVNSMASVTSVFDFTVRDQSEQPVSLDQHRDKVLLIVNTASACGFTPQYAELQTLYQTYQDRGFSVLAFPCNQFGAQEPGTNADIGEFCSSRFRIDFPVYAKIDVNGAAESPLYRYLKYSAGGLFGSKSIKWNFTKFLIDRNGVPVTRYGPMTKPLSLVSRIEALLSESD